ncbi:hypothetical protein V8B97DRAFT_1916037 [Scleroderma yunnanense]
MVDSIITVFTPMKTAGAVGDAVSDDDLVEFQQESGESKGEQVYRYLKTLVGWHAAVNYLCTLQLSELLRNESGQLSRHLPLCASRKARYYSQIWRQRAGSEEVRGAVEGPISICGESYLAILLLAQFWSIKLA